MKKSPSRDKSSARKGQDRGSALILTLGMLMLVMTLFISFTIVAIYNQQSVRVSESIIKSRFQAATALQRVYALLASEWANALDSNNIYPSSKSGQTGYFADPSGGWSGRNYWASLGADSEGIDEALHVVIAGQDFTSNTELDSTVGWIHTLDPDGSGAIIARVAYVVVDESGKIDPSAVVKSGTAEGTETRVGLNPDEISLLALYDTDGEARQLQFTTETNGRLATNARWFSYFYIFKNCSAIAASPSETITDTIFPFSYDIEAFYNGIRDKHRFDLINKDWDAIGNDITTAGIDADAADYWADISIQSVNTNDGGIPWLANCATAELKNQIIANLVDYCDTDSIPSTDYNATTQPIPTYIGLEKLPFINELLFEVGVNSAGGGNYNFNVGCTPELINMWDTDVGANAKLEVKITLTATMSPSNTVITKEIIFGNDDSMAGEFELAAAVPAKSYQALTMDTQTTDAAGGALSMGGDDTLQNVSITINYAKLIDKASKVLWDYAFSTDFPMVVTATVKDAEVHMVSAETNDPRHNLPIDQWTWSASWQQIGNGTVGATNSVCLPANAVDGSFLPANPLMDVESIAVDPWDISTAYIRNAAMTSLWELGALHRGAAWQSINLTKFNATSTSTTGLDNYEDGDANLLDQVKLNNYDFTYGRVNINTHSQKVVRALLARIPVGGNYATPGTATLISESAAEDIAAQSESSPADGEWRYENGAEGSEDPFFSRGEIARVDRLWDQTAYTPHGLTQATDAAREEIIGKVTNICSTRSNFFTVVVVAQMIRDYPTGIKGGTRGTYDDGIDEILAEQKVLAVIRRDAFTNTFSTLRFEYLDE